MGTVIADIAAGPPWHAGAVEPGERMLIRCEGGPSMSRLVRYPPPLEIEEETGLYVLVDDGPPQTWWYEFVPRVA